MSKTAVVILNWNGRQFLEIFLRMVVDRSPEADIWVVDNFSTDDSVEFLKSNFPEVNLLQLDKNYGYSGGYNRAIEAISADYYVLLNSDIEVSEGWLPPMIKIMDDDSKVAAVQPKILSFAEKNRFEYAGASGGFIDILGYPFCRGRFIGQKTEQDRGQYDDSREIFWATGAAMMIRGETFKKTGGLDENFFAHMEEIDLCWRMKRSGLKIMVEPASIVYHVGGGTLPTWSPTKTYLNFRNNISMLYKNLTIAKFATIYSIRVITDFLRFISYVAVLKLRFANAVINGHIDFWRMRKKLDRQNQLGHMSVPHIYKGSIVLKSLLGNGTFGKMMVLALFLGIMSCNGKGTTDLIDVVVPGSATIGDVLTIGITEKSPRDSIIIYVDNKKISETTYKTSRVGRIPYRVMAYKDGNIDCKTGTILVSTKKVPSIKNIEVIKEISHNTDSYTQGLVFSNGTMYESVGQYGKSALLETDPKTGKILRKNDLAKKYFAEGLELLGNSLFQLTWQEKTCFKYDAKTFEQTGAYSYKGEGWGLTTDGQKLYMSDGTSSIKIISPENFSTISVIQVMDQRGEVSMLNELEWIDGRIWANIYTKSWIAIINPSTGEVESYVNCADLEKRIEKTVNTDVLNGIAYDKESGDIFLTGKNWNKMFKIKIR